MSDVITLSDHLKEGRPEHDDLAPMRMLAEEAGGRASSGSERIMEIRPNAYHQRVPLLIGSPEDVILAEEFLSGRR